MGGRKRSYWTRMLVTMVWRTFTWDMVKGDDVGQGEIVNAEETKDEVGDEIVDVEGETIMCARCSLPLVEPKLCSMCFETYYCDRECQLLHWRAHRQVCVQKTCRFSSDGPPRLVRIADPDV